MLSVEVDGAENHDSFVYVCHAAFYQRSFHEVQTQNGSRILKGTGPCRQANR